MEDKSFVNPEKSRVLTAEVFGKSLGVLLAEKIVAVQQDFDAMGFVRNVEEGVIGKGLLRRVEVIAQALRRYLPESYAEALRVLKRIMGPENQEESGMFRKFYWLMPVGKFVEKYGLDDFAESIRAIEEITKRNTGEFAIRSFARKYPEEILDVCKKWAKSKNFHLRRLASEGLRPKLPWATRLDLWNANPWPIFEVLDLLKEDEVKFVRRSVANHVRDWVKVNPKETKDLIVGWSSSSNEHTRWIIKYALR